MATRSLIGFKVHPSNKTVLATYVHGDGGVMAHWIYDLWHKWYHTDWLMIRMYRGLSVWPRSISLGNIRQATQDPDAHNTLWSVFVRDLITSQSNGWYSLYGTDWALPITTERNYISMNEAWDIEDRLKSSKKLPIPEHNKLIDKLLNLWSKAYAINYAPVAYPSVSSEDKPLIKLDHIVGVGQNWLTLLTPDKLQVYKAHYGVLEYIPNLELDIIECDIIYEFRGEVSLLKQESGDWIFWETGERVDASNWETAQDSMQVQMGYAHNLFAQAICTLHPEINENVRNPEDNLRILAKMNEAHLSFKINELVDLYQKYCDRNYVPEYVYPYRVDKRKDRK